MTQAKFNILKRLLYPSPFTKVGLQDVYNHLEQTGPQNVTQVYVALRCEQSLASQHLRDLLRIGLTTRVKNGKMRIHAVNADKKNKIELALNSLTKLIA